MGLSFLIKSAKGAVCDYCRINIFGKRQCCNLAFEGGRFVPGVYICFDDPYCTQPIPNRRYLSNVTNVTNIPDLDQATGICHNSTDFPGMFCLDNEEIKGTVYNAKLGSPLTVTVASFAGLVAIINIVVMGILLKKCADKKVISKEVSETNEDDGSSTESEVEQKFEV